MCRELQSQVQPQCRPQVSTLGVMCSNRLAIHALVFAGMFRARNATGKLELNSFVHTRQPRNLFVAKTTFKKRSVFLNDAATECYSRKFNWLGCLYVSHGISSECGSRSTKLYEMRGYRGCMFEHVWATMFWKHCSLWGVLAITMLYDDFSRF